MKLQKLFPALLLSLALILAVMTGCGAKTSSSSNEMSSAAISDWIEPEAPSEEAWDYDRSDAYTEENGAAADDLLDKTVLEASVERKLTYRANVSMETKDFRGALDAIDALVAAQNGYVASSSVSDYGDDSDHAYARDAYFEVQVPAGSLEAFLDGLKEIGNVRNVSKEVEDITTSYYNTQSRLDSLLEEEQRLIAMQEKADTLEELLTIEGYLSDVRSEINYLHSMMQVYEKQVAYSTVNINLNEVVDYTPAPVQDPTLGERIAEAFQGSLSFFSEVGQGLIVGIVFMAPVLLVIATIVVVIVVCVKSGSKRRARRRAEQAAKGQRYVPVQSAAPAQTPAQQTVQQPGSEQNAQQPNEGKTK